MLKKFALWLVFGLAAGIAIGVANKNLPGGVGFGVVAGILFALLQRGYAKK